MHKNVLISGASGLVGTRLTELLKQKDYQISHLSRSNKEGAIPVFQWNVKDGTVDEGALTGVYSIIHLAGAGIADKAWTRERKKEILESRTKSTQLLFKTLKERTHGVKTFVSASAIGYYGFGGDEKVFQEEGSPANDFLADVVRQWEASVDEIASLGIRVVKIRIGILLSKNGGALAEMIKPIRFGFGSPLGSGSQIMSWIHMDDVCGIFIKAIEDENMKGVYNAVSPNPATNDELMRAAARATNKPFWVPSVPSFVLKVILGEMADLVLKGSRVSAEKIQNAGYEFLHPDLDGALKDLLQKG